MLEKLWKNNEMGQCSTYVKLILRMLFNTMNGSFYQNDNIPTKLGTSP